jgi:hypothetical protein
VYKEYKIIVRVGTFYSQSGDSTVRVGTQYSQIGDTVQSEWRYCTVRVGTPYGQSGDTVQSYWRHCTVRVETLYSQSEDIKLSKEQTGKQLKVKLSRHAVLECACFHIKGLSSRSFAQLFDFL